MICCSCASALTMITGIAHVAGSMQAAEDFVAVEVGQVHIEQDDCWLEVARGRGGRRRQSGRAEADIVPAFEDALDEPQVHHCLRCRALSAVRDVSRGERPMAGRRRSYPMET